MTQKRQLAAIMFADIEGYTALMQQDEAKAVAFQKRFKNTFIHTIDAFHGNIIQFLGDGILSTFSSTVEAVECAIELQNSFLVKPQIPVRIGIHVGDIVYADNNIVGNAVNVASRIESCAIPGSILISDKVHDQIRNHSHIQVEFLDAYDLKNVDGATPLFAISNQGLVIPKPEDVKGKLKTNIQTKTKGSLKKKLITGLIIAAIVTLFSYLGFINFNFSPKDKSIAVLPFENLSLEDNTEIFSDGITEDIVTNLSKIKDLHTISRTSVRRFKNTEKPLREIAKELGVSYILVGTTRKDGDNVRVSTQLIEAKSDKNIWADRYDVTLSDIFKVQSEMSKQIAEALQLNLTLEEQKNLVHIPSRNLEAYRYFLRGRQEADKRTTESIAKSIELYKKAIEIDPNYAEAYAEIANSTFLQTYYGNANPDEAAKQTEAYLKKAESIDNNISRIYTVKGLLYNHTKQLDKAKIAFEKAIKLSPSDVTARHQYSTYYFYKGDYEEQLKQSQTAFKLDPLSFATASSYFTALTYNKKYKEAEELIKDIDKNNINDEDTFVINRLYMRLYLSMPDYKLAIKPLRMLAQHDPSYYRQLGYSYGQVGDTIEALKTIDSIKKLDKTRLKNHRVAVVYAGLQQHDSAFFYLDTSRNKSTFFNHNSISFFDRVKQDPRYETLLKTHGISN